MLGDLLDKEIIRRFPMVTNVSDPCWRGFPYLTLSNPKGFRVPPLTSADRNSSGVVSAGFTASALLLPISSKHECILWAITVPKVDLTYKSLSIASASLTMFVRTMMASTRDGQSTTSSPSSKASSQIVVLHGSLMSVTSL